MTMKLRMTLGVAAILVLISPANLQAQKCTSGNCANGTGTKDYGSYKYTGEFRNGKKHGRGTVTLFSRTIKGAWRDDKLIHGEESYSDGFTLSGSYNEGFRSGKGVMTWRDGRRYEGEWKDLTAVGKGVMTYPDKRRYVGEFQGDQYHGRGILYHANGSVYRDGPWDKGVFKGVIKEKQQASTPTVYRPEKYGEMSIRLSELPAWKFPYADAQGKYHYLIAQEKCTYGLELEQWYQDRGFVESSHNKSNFCGKKMPPGYQVLVKPVLFVWGKQWSAAQIAERKRIAESSKNRVTTNREKEYRGTYCWESCSKSCYSGSSTAKGQGMCLDSCRKQCSR
ncbi:MAG TPA: hypothetical protein PKM65_02785 [Spirochaetota bacterium]|nr:hypothetical protein [Spirochaetota bacterium]HNT11989.1 hypothetical protein [Spirochaetota bacterium]